MNITLETHKKSRILEKKNIRSKIYMDHLVSEKIRTLCSLELTFGIYYSY